MRNDLIPKLISEYNPGVKQHLNRLADIFLQADNLLLERTKKQLKRLTLDAAQGKISLDLAGMQKLIPIERYYLMRLIFRKLCGHEVDFMGAHYDAVEEVLFSQGSKKLALPHGVSVKKLYEELIFFTGTDALPAAESEFIEIEADRARAVYGDYRFSFKHLKVFPPELNPEEASFNIIIDADKIKYPFKIRFRKPGDRFIPFGMNQFKRLKEFFIDEKVPKYDRDSLPLMDDGEILFWIVGYRIDNRVRRDETSTHYLQITAEPITTKPNRAAKKKKSDKRGNDESDEL
jgi:tRNA(Ile)-lysidine synthase